MLNPRLQQALLTGATALSVTLLSSGCIFVHLKGEAAAEALREIEEERWERHEHVEVHRTETVRSSPFGEHTAMTVDLDVPKDQLEATFETLSQGVASRLENRGAEIVRFDHAGELERLYTYEEDGATGRVRVRLAPVTEPSGTPYRFEATWLRDE